MFYDNFDGGVKASLCLYNLYLAKRATILEKVKQATDVDVKLIKPKTVFTSKTVVDFCKKNRLALHESHRFGSN